MGSKLNPEDIRQKIVALKLEHRDLDEVLTQMSNNLHSDQLQVKRLKKRKLQLKDMIARLESDLLPDIPA